MIKNKYFLNEAVKFMVDRAKIEAAKEN